MKSMVLIVDDDADFVEATRLLLEANDYQVLTAANGQEGFSLVKQHSPQIIILDMMMTYKTEGAETAKAIAADAAVSHIPIIMITGAKKEPAFPLPLTPDQQELPVTAILEKPLNPELLLKTIKGCLQKSLEDAPPQAGEIKELISDWRGKEGNLIMILHQLQNHYGYIPRDVSFKLCAELDIPLARIYEVISFYHYFQLEPPGKHTIAVCMGTACYLKGAPAILQELKEILNIEAGQTTANGLFKLVVVRCIGCCGLAPVIMIDDKVYGDLKPGKLVDIISQYSNQSEKSQREGVAL